MIFKRIEKRRVQRLFGQFIPHEQMDHVLSDYPKTEWAAFKLFIARLNPFRKYDLDSLNQLKRISRQILEESQSNGTSLSDTK